MSNPNYPYDDPDTTDPNNPDANDPWLAPTIIDPDGDGDDDRNTPRYGPEIWYNIGYADAKGAGQKKAGGIVPPQFQSYYDDGYNYGDNERKMNPESW